MSDIEKLNEEKSELKNKIIQAEKNIKNMKKRIKYIDSQLWEKCNHVWTIDPACSDDDLCKKYCTKCFIRNCYYI
tara:strand:- start:161 stop:385 length:225 start_codon:yes stop_codon:yes gene_type:complete